MTTDLLMEVAGWIGAVLILAGYGLLTAGRLTAKSPLYQWMNVVGAAGFILNSGWNGAIPSAALNVVWAGIGLTALWRMTRKAA
ncbi:MAG: hypothetical protein H0W65_10215 [Sphingomonas sp.]|uniref:CBU_0592 family membrane protein n=1 Tax=Sphingomonas sp. TaxID=28214 RepID=UPI0017FA08BC|nr:hypothetical protein [Sphingomonas sp.]MBA3668077.1 hypothetical protein [Sphingomonas sp.]